MTTDPPGVWSKHGEIWTVEPPGGTSVAVVACVHGDEVCGKRAIERVISEHGEVDGVKFVLANPRAYAQGKRYIDDDLNRVFPGNPEAKSYERRLAAQLWDEFEDHIVLDLHSTVSAPTPFALFQNWTKRVYDAVRALQVRWVVDIGFVEGGMIGHFDGVSVEFDKKHPQRAADEAYDIVTQFLAINDYIDVESKESDPFLYRITERIPKEREGFEVVRGNFEEIYKGDMFARRQGGVARPYDAFFPFLTVRADEPFHPVLVSDGGYEDIYGFKSRAEGPISKSEGKFEDREVKLTIPTD